MNKQGDNQKTYKIPISTGLFEHYGRIKDALWLFMWYVDRTSREDNAPGGSRVGIVLGGLPVRDSDVARAFKVNSRTIRRWRSRLSRAGYIRQVRTPAGYAIRVVKSKKWSREPNKSDRPDLATHAESDGTQMDGHTQGERTFLSGREVPIVSTPIGHDRYSELPVVSDPKYRHYKTEQGDKTDPPPVPLKKGDDTHRQKTPDAPLAFSGKELRITERVHGSFTNAFPWVDLPAEYAKMDAWLAAHLDRRIKKFSQFAYSWVAKIRRAPKPEEFDPLENLPRLG